MVEAERCPQCGEELTADAPDGLCPECLLQQGISAQHDWADQGVRVLSSPKISPFIPPEPSELAESFPQLEIVQLLGQGGMGAVYKARQKKLDRLVALKILPLQAGSDPAFAERFAREARALARLNHPNIVGVHDFGEVGGLYYFVMEYVDGVNLRQLLESGQLTPEEALKIIPQVCEALQYAHEEEIVHRDIKPENILLNKRGRVKIADFGLAKLLGATPSGFSLTGSQQVMGTPFYMAPEQMHKARTVDHRADIYSLGVVFYEMLTGELPLGRFAPPSQTVGVDQRLDEVVFRALEKEPEHRYQRISEVKSAVESITADGPTTQRAQGDRPLAPARRQPDGPRLRVAFEHWGTRQGLLCLVGEALFLEFDAGVITGWFSSRFKEIQIRLEDLESVRLEKKWLKIRAHRLSTLASIPGCLSGEANFFVRREDRSAAEQFVAQVTRRLPGAPQAAWPLEGEPKEYRDLGAVERRLRVPALGLLVSGIGTWIFWFVALLIHLGGGFGPLHVRLGVLQFVAAAVGTVLLVGAICIKKLVSYPFAVFTAWIAFLPVSPAWLLSMPMGVLALLRLWKAETKAAFAQKAQGMLTLAAGEEGFPTPSKGDLKEYIQRRVWWPALGLNITGILGFCFWGIVILLVVFNDYPDHSPPSIAGLLGIGALALGAAGVVNLGGICLRNYEAYPVVEAASVLAILPWSPAAAIGLPIGLWTLHTLRRPEVRAAFRRQELPAGPGPVVPDKNTPPLTGPVRRKVQSFLGSIRSLFFASRVKGPIPTQDYQPRRPEPGVPDNDLQV